MASCGYFTVHERAAYSVLLPQQILLSLAVLATHKTTCCWHAAAAGLFVVFTSCIFIFKDANLQVRRLHCCYSCCYRSCVCARALAPKCPLGV
jgi:hypothetical protein